MIKLKDENDSKSYGLADSRLDGANGRRAKVKFEFFGQEIIEKPVKLARNTGRVYLPPTWVGHKVKIVKID